MRPAAAVATPAATVALDDPFELEVELRAFPAGEDRLLEALALFRLDALALFGLLEALLLLGLDPFELREVVFRLLEDAGLAWAITPP